MRRKYIRFKRRKVIWKQRVGGESELSRAVNWNAEAPLEWGLIGAKEMSKSVVAYFVSPGYIDSVNLISSSNSFFLSLSFCSHYKKKGSQNKLSYHKTESFYIVCKTTFDITGNATTLPLTTFLSEKVGIYLNILLVFTSRIKASRNNPILYAFRERTFLIRTLITSSFILIVNDFYESRRIWQEELSLF